MNSSIIPHIQSALNKNVLSLSQSSGGSIASAYRVEMSDGQSLFVKSSPQHHDMFVKEANGLRELAKANVLRIPEVILASEELLILEYLPVTTPTQRTQFFEQFGKHFAQLHRHSATQFGFIENNYIGSNLQENLPQTNSWKDFFVEHRLEFQFRLAEQNGYNDKEIISLFTKLEKQIDRLIPNDGEPPTLLHGDLWNGNFLCVENNTPALIDPAVYYGHREADLAMTMLFGGFSEAFYASYHETYPLNDEWRRRCELYKLYHLFNHLNLFGKGYYSQVVGTMKYLVR
ncbi:MAG: fructosamine kinase family protein [Bacteroidota bacterium]